MKTVTFDAVTQQKIDQAINTILNGVCKRCDISETVKVYEVKDTIRIDLKVMNINE